MKLRNPIAREMASGKYKRAVIESKKNKVGRKAKHKEKWQ